ncbi:MAG: type 1 glutamine amidotransferase [Thermocrispum agreste]|uniref:Type 1 glutamine amidotransferase n=1 Tax=Thermocrispum agreste TaxID=37925 RepID=A0ABD6FKS3_9PSEU
MAGASAEHTSGPAVLVIQPDDIVGIARFGRWLADAGVACRIVRPYAGEPVRDRLAEHGLLILGGRMSANDDHDHPWLSDVRKLLRHAVESSTPTLGICLGGQLLARAMGGTVERGDRGMETGVVRVRWRPEADVDPLVTGLPSPLTAVSSHRDMVAVLPPGASWLGSSEMYPHQAFRVGARAWGVQFHPEASIDDYRRWRAVSTASDPETLERMRVGERELERLDAQVAAHCRQLAARFGEHVCARWRQRAAAQASSLRGHGR